MIGLVDRWFMNCSEVFEIFHKNTQPVLFKTIKNIKILWVLLKLSEYTLTFCQKFKKQVWKIKVNAF
jgi:hypothetical protein